MNWNKIKMYISTGQIKETNVYVNIHGKGDT